VTGKIKTINRNGREERNVLSRESTAHPTASQHPDTPKPGASGTPQPGQAGQVNANKRESKHKIFETQRNSPRRACGRVSRGLAKSDLTAKVATDAKKSSRE